MAEPEKPKSKKGLTPEEIGKTVREMETLERDLKLVGESSFDASVRDLQAKDKQ